MIAKHSRYIHIDYSVLFHHEEWEVAITEQPVDKHGDEDECAPQHAIHILLLESSPHQPAQHRQYNAATGRESAKRKTWAEKPKLAQRKSIRSWRTSYHRVKCQPATIGVYSWFKHHTMWNFIKSVHWCIRQQLPVRASSNYAFCKLCGHPSETLEATTLRVKIPQFLRKRAGDAAEDHLHNNTQRQLERTDGRDADFNLQFNAYHSHGLSSYSLVWFHLGRFNAEGSLVTNSTGWQRKSRVQLANAFVYKMS